MELKLKLSLLLSSQAWALTSLARLNSLLVLDASNHASHKLAYKESVLAKGFVGNLQLEEVAQVVLKEIFTLKM